MSIPNNADQVDPTIKSLMKGFATHKTKDITFRRQ